MERSNRNFGGTTSWTSRGQKRSAPSAYEYYDHESHRGVGQQKRSAPTYEYYDQHHGNDEDEAAYYHYYNNNHHHHHQQQHENELTPPIARTTTTTITRTTMTMPTTTRMEPQVEQDDDETDDDHDTNDENDDNDNEAEVDEEKELKEIDLKEENLKKQLKNCHMRVKQLTTQISNLQKKRTEILNERRKKRLGIDSTSTSADPPDGGEDPSSPSSQTTKGRPLRFGGNLVAQQMKDIVKTTYYKKAISFVKNGLLWDIPPPSLDKQKPYPIFNWLPSYMIDVEEGNWRPKCPECGERMAKHANNNPPRLIYGPHNENYILNSPERFKCRYCMRERIQKKEMAKLFSQAQKAQQQSSSTTSTTEQQEEQEQETTSRRGRPRRSKHDKKLYANSCDERIVIQICDTYPDVGKLFPVFLTHKGGIDIQLLHSMEATYETEFKPRKGLFASKQMRYFYNKWNENKKRLAAEAAAAAATKAQDQEEQPQNDEPNDDGTTNTTEQQQEDEATEDGDDQQEQDNLSSSENG